MTLDLFRRRVVLALASLVAVLGAATLAIELFRFGALGPGSLLALGLAALMGAGFALFRLRPTGRHMIVAVLMGQVAASLIALRGHPMQVDMHMAFFAALAMCSLLYDVRSILIGTALVAVHHLALGLFFSELVFYQGGGLDRIALHAVILVSEALALIWMTLNTNAALRQADEHSRDAAMSAEEARESSQRATDTAGLTARHMEQMAHLQGEFATVVQAGLVGDFSHRMSAEYEDPALNHLASDTNALVEQISRGLGATQTVLQSLAQADVTKRVEGEFHGVFAELQANTNSVAEKLSDIVGQLKRASASLKPRPKSSPAPTIFPTGPCGRAKRSSRHPLLSRNWQRPSRRMRLKPGKPAPPRSR